MAVQARFFVAEVTRLASFPGCRLLMRVVSRGGANSDWASATPSGEITMNITNVAAADWFAERVGKEIAISFDEAPEG